MHATALLSLAFGALASATAATTTTPAAFTSTTSTSQSAKPNKPNIYTAVNLFPNAECPGSDPEFSVPEAWLEDFACHSLGSGFKSGTVTLTYMGAIQNLQLFSDADCKTRVLNLGNSGNATTSGETCITADGDGWFGMIYETYR